jgi:hypothetical protein
MHKRSGNIMHTFLCIESLEKKEDVISKIDRLGDWDGRGLSPCMWGWILLAVFLGLKISSSLFLKWLKRETIMDSSWSIHIYIYARIYICIYIHIYLYIKTHTYLKFLFLPDTKANSGERVAELCGSGPMSTSLPSCGLQLVISANSEEDFLPILKEYA